MRGFTLNKTSCFRIDAKIKNFKVNYPKILLNNVVTQSVSILSL